jgi:xanthine dehydrogenase accessory factor
MTNRPDDRLHDRIPETALDWHRAGKSVAIATVIETWSSAPRPVGSQLAISAAAQMIGSVSGGCVEGAVVVEALEVLTDRKPRTLTYGIADETAFAAGLACGGTIRIVVEPVGKGGIPPDLLSALGADRAAARPVALVTRLDDGTHGLLHPGNDAMVDRAFDTDRSGLTEDGRFIAIHNPPLRLIIIGAVHIAAPLLTIARSCGYACTLIDPRSAFGTDQRFPGETVLDDWPDAAVQGLRPDGRTAVVTLTHDPKLDDPAILAALQSQAFYIGCLGSSRTHASRLDRLRALGVDKDSLARVHGPVGLKIGAQTAAEIAISIMAEITATLRKAGTPQQK